MIRGWLKRSDEKGGRANLPLFAYRLILKLRGEHMAVGDLVREMYEKVMRISDLDWSEICDKYDCGVHPDQLRKMGAGIKLAAEAGMLA